MTISKEAIEAAKRANTEAKLFGGEPDDWVRAAIEAALPFLPIAEVKALEWREDWGGSYDDIPEWRANTPWGSVVVSVAGYRDECGKPCERHSDIPEELKARLLAERQADFETRILSALLSSPGKDGGQEVEAVGQLREALQRLEDCCDQLAGTRSREVYDAMINSGQAEALIDLDNARLNAREVLSRPSPYPVSDTVAVVTGDAAIALGLPEGTKLYTRPQPASTALVEAARFLADRLEDFRQKIDDIDDEREFEGHIIPALARLRAAISASRSTSREGER